MRRAPLLAATLVLGLAPLLDAGEAGGVRWEGDLEAGLLRAAQEGRPVLLAVNALESERANQALATQHYPGTAWGEGTRDWVCLVGNPNLHGDGSRCPRYPGIGCEVHQAVLRYVVRRLAPGGDLISPQHVVLDPDGRLAWRREYFTPDVTPQVFERLLPAIAPDLAVARAGVLRQARLEELETGSPAEAAAAARAWLASPDPLAAAGVLLAADLTMDEARRDALVRALGGVREDHRAVAWIAAYDAACDPDEDPGLTEAWLDAMAEADTASAFELASRAAAHARDPALRRRLLARVFPEGVPARLVLPAHGLDSEGVARAEVAAALGLPVELAASPGAEGAALPPALRARVRRLTARAGAGSALPLGAALGSGSPTALREALLGATAAEVEAEATAVRRVLRERAEERVRLAAALALLTARLDEGGEVAPLLAAAVFDPVEGPDTRREAVLRLGEEPAATQDGWREAIRRHLLGR